MDRETEESEILRFAEKRKDDNHKGFFFFRERERVCLFYAAEFSLRVAVVNF